MNRFPEGQRPMPEPRQWHLIPYRELASSVAVFESVGLQMSRELPDQVSTLEQSKKLGEFIITKIPEDKLSPVPTEALQLDDYTAAQRVIADLELRQNEMTNHGVSNEFLHGMKIKVMDETDELRRKWRKDVSKARRSRTVQRERTERLVDYLD